MNLAVTLSPECRFNFCRPAAILSVAVMLAFLSRSLPAKEYVALKTDARETVENVAFSADGSMVATYGTSSITLWDAKTGAKRWSHKADTNGFMPPLAFSPDGKRLAAADQDLEREGSIMLLNTETGKVEKTVKVNSRPFAKRPLPKGDPKGDFDDFWSEPVMHLSFAPYGETLAVATRTTVQLYDLKTGKSRRVETHWKPRGGGGFRANTMTSYVAFSADGKTLATGETRGGAIKLWDTKTLKVTKSFKVPNGLWDGRLAYSSYGRTLAALSKRDVLVWNIESGKKRRLRHGRRSAPMQLAITDDGRMLVTSGFDGALRFWDVERGKVIRTLKARKQLNSLMKLTFSRDGRTLATVNEEPTHVLLWKVEPPQPKVAATKPDSKSKKPTPRPKPKDPEVVAQSIFDIARRLYKTNPTACKRRLQQIINDYPGTKAAARAGTVLEKMKASDGGGE